MTSRNTTKKTISLAALMSAMLISWHPAAKGEIISTVADLSVASATENTFNVNVSILNTPALSNTQQVIYTGLLRPMMDIDFSDVNNPVVNTLDFHGQNADIAHTDATFTVSLGLAELKNIAGSIYTPMGSSPAPVTGGKYNSADHEIIAWQGTIDITPVIGFTTAIDVSNNFFRRSLGGVNDSTVNVTLNNIATGVATYDLELITPLEQVVLRTGDAQIDAAITITIDGNLVARSQFIRPIPEPATAALVLGMSLLAAIHRRR